MGYILPINFEQYNQYHIRGMREEFNPFRTDQIERSGKASLQLGNIPVMKASFEPKKKIEQSGKKINEVYAEVTGIGLRFNRKI